MEVVSVGKRLRRIRKQFGIRQDEITGDLVTRNMISIIENDKASLTPKVAQIVSEHINQICIDRAIDFSITVEALLESEEEQVKKIALRLTEEISAGEFNLNDERKKAEVLEIENRLVMNEDYDLAFDLDTICETYFSNKKQYFEAYYYCKRAVDLSAHMIGSLGIFKAYINVSYNLIHLERYKEALYYCNLTLEKFPNLEPKERYRVLMNKNLAASRLGEWALSSATIDDMLKIENLDDLDRNKVWISKANRLAEEGHWEESVQIYNRIYSELEMTPQKYLVLSNLIDIYINMNKPEALMEIMNQSISALEIDEEAIKNPYLEKIYFKLAKGYQHVEQEENLLAYMEKALEFCYKEKEYSQLKAILDFKIIYCCEEKRDDLIKEIVALTLKWVKEKIIKREDQCLWRLMSYLTEFKDIKNLKKIMACFTQLNE